MSFLRDCKERSFDRSGRSIVALSASPLAETEQTATLADVIVHLPTRGNAVALRPLKRNADIGGPGYLRLPPFDPTPLVQNIETLFRRLRLVGVLGGAAVLATLSALAILR
ncbi:MAG: hypothetical protein ACK4SI_07550 [Brevundimonas aurantiaca]|uniref:hypothetical protein n=1 Tax=Brevundimonas aurantiaca TaxID=74316 RepID=UPI00391CF97A